MKNGDQVTGSIIKKDAATLTIKTVNFGTVTLSWDQIVSVKADAPLTVVLPNDKSVQGTITTSGDKIVINETGTTDTVAPKDIVALRNADEQKAYLKLLKPGLFELWLITGNIAFAGTSGNSTSRTFTIPINLVRATRNDKLTLYFSYVNGQATVNGVSAETANAIRGGWSYSHNLAPKIFANVFNDYTHDVFQNLNLRGVLGGGLGWHAWKKDKGFIDLVGGADFNHSSYMASTAAPAYTQNAAEAFFGDDLGYKLGKKFALTQSYRLFENLSQTGNERQTFNLGFSAVVAKYLTWNASAIDQYISDPAPGRKKNDFLYSTGLGFTISR
jgi:hypothetical protein